MLNKTLIIIFLLHFCLNDNSFAEPDTEKNNKDVLVFFALAPNTPAYHPILDGIRQKLNDKYGDSFTLHTEYFGIEAYGDGKFPKDIFDTYNKKYSSINLDLLICVGINIIPIVREYSDKYLLDLPVISLDFDFSKYGIASDLSLNEYTATIPLKINFEASIENALDLFPNTNSIYLIAGTSKADRLLLAVSKIAATRLKNKKNINIITDASMDEVLQRATKIPANSLIFIPSFQTDNKNVNYTNQESVRLICRSSNVPVFVLLSSGFGVGSIGGYLINFDEVGLLAGDCAAKILNGTDPKSIVIAEKDYYEHLYDWRVLKRWNLVNSDLIPAGSTIIYENISFIDRFKWIGGLVLLFILLQTFLIVNLIRLNRRQKMMTQKIIETENKYRDFLHEDRSLRLGQLTASLSHELNQPLTAILSTAQAGINFINSNEASPELLKQILQKIVDNDKRTASILSSIRGMLKLEYREKEKVNLNLLIEDIIDVYKSEALKYDIELNLNLPFEPVFVKADAIQIEQVILNLIINASHSLQKNNTNNKLITISLSSTDDNVIVSVEDNGSGIDKSIKEKLFRPFVTSKEEGTGIGLVICRTIVEDHGGKIWTENIPDSGAKFSFSLGKYKNE
jgi:signal transduction histidine kinase